MRVTFRIPLIRAVLSVFFFACAVLGLVACAAAWFFLMTTICSNPRAPVPESQHVIPYNCHGMKVFIPPWQDAMLHWLMPTGLLFIVLGMVAGATVLLALVKTAQGGWPGHRVRIVAVPPGEAPQWVREKWVGLELPLAQGSPEAQAWRTAGVLTGPRGFLALASRQLRGGLAQRSGFVVNVLEAIAILERASPEAAQWWRTNAGHLMTPARCFVFPKHVCVVLQ